MELSTNSKLSKKDLIKALREGHYVQHENWESDEYLFLDGNKIKDESGKACTLSDFTGEEYERPGAWLILESEEDSEGEDSPIMSFEDALDFMGERPTGGSRKLSDEQIEQVMALKRYGYSYKQLAPKFDIANPTSLGLMVRKYKIRTGIIETHD